uniref:Uncharacterized protein n=1 Tax=Arundo donax TaxID=35708 RepID=A0A0A9H7Z4_ARUDO
MPSRSPAAPELGLLPLPSPSPDASPLFLMG